jgi:hypothetical protein
MTQVALCLTVDAKNSKDEMEWNKES